jgi:tetratricopeptide (TPR) repeat protein
MAPPPPPGGPPGYGAASGGGGGGAAGAPPMGRYGTLRVVSGNDQGKVIELNRPVTTIGRGADQMLVVADIAVSRRHLQIHMTQTGYRLQDMGSPNGTMVNGKRVSEVQLMDADQIEVGNSLMRFEHPPSRPQQEAPPPPPAYAAPPPAMNYQQPGYGAPMQQPMQQMGYQQPGYPPQGGYMQQQPMQMQPMAPAYPPPPSVVQPVPQQMMAPQPQAMQSSVQSAAQPSMFMEPSAIAMAPIGALSMLAIPQKRNLYFGVVGAALFVGFVGLMVSLVRGGNPQKYIDKATELYEKGTKEFTANHYSEAKKAFQEALALAPDSADLKRFVDACDTEEKAHKVIDQAKQQLEDRKYTDALKTFGKVEKTSIQYEDAQQQARMAKREAVKEIVNQATSTAKSDVPGALEKVNKGLEDIDPESSELNELKSKLSNAPAAKPPTPVEEPVAVVENTEKKEPKKEEPKKEPKKEAKKEEPKKEPKKEEPAAGGDLSSNKTALAAYKGKDFSGAISAMKGAKGPKAASTVKDLEEIKSKTDQASKAESGKPADALSAYQAAASIDKRLGGGLSGFYSGKISDMQKKAGGSSTASKPAASGGDAAKDGQADQLLSQAKGLVTKNPAQARNLCRKVMQLYGNSPKNPKVQEAYRLLNSIKGGKDDDDDF